MARQGKDPQAEVLSKTNKTLTEAISIASHLNEFCHGSQEVRIDGLRGGGHVNVVQQAMDNSLEKKITTIRQVLKIGIEVSLDA